MELKIKEEVKLFLSLIRHCAVWGGVKVYVHSFLSFMPGWGEWSIFLSHPSYDLCKSTHRI